MKDENYKIRNAVISYLNDNLEEHLDYTYNHRYRKENLGKITEFFFVHHETLTAFAIIFLFILIGVFAFIGGTQLWVQIDLNHTRELAKICNETGYGCKSDTKNTDIQYKDTPLVQIEKSEK